jgi:hypothetical protein
MAAPATGGGGAGGTKTPRKQRQVNRGALRQAQPQKAPNREKKPKSQFEKFIFTYVGGYETIIEVKAHLAAKLKLVDATAEMEAGYSNGKTNHAFKGVKHGKELVIYPSAPEADANGRFVKKGGYQFQVPGDANFADVVNFLTPFKNEVYAFKWGKTTSFFYNGRAKTA